MVVLGLGTLCAQSFRGTIVGTVSDNLGAVISGAQVTVRNVNTGLARKANTSADGSYYITELPIGTYEVNVSEKGFRTFVANGVVVNVASERRVDAELQPVQVDTQVVLS